MAKLTGPLFSLRASQSLGNTLTFASWRGIQYVRTLVIPENPNTADQQEVRGVFATLVEIWKRMPALGREPWELDAAGKPYTDRNRIIGINVPLLQGSAVLTPFQFTPGTGGALPPLTAVSADGGAQVLNITLTQPAVPAGWTQISSTGLAILQGDPSPVLIRTPVAAEDAAAPFTLIAISVGAAGTYVWGSWNVFTHPDGTTRASPALSGTQVIA